MYHYIFVKVCGMYTTKGELHRRLWALIMVMRCQCRFTLWNAHTTVLEDFGGDMWLGRLVRDSKYMGKFIINVTSPKSFCIFNAISIKILAAFFFL